MPLSRRSPRLYLLIALVLVTLLGLGWPVIRLAYDGVRTRDYSRRAAGALAAKDYPAAELFALNALRHNMGRADTWRLLARIRSEGGLPDADIALHRAYVLNPNDFESGLGAVDAAMARGEFVAALPAAMDLVEHHPGATTFQRAAVCLAQIGQRDEALKMMDRAAASDSASETIRITRAALLASGTNAAQQLEAREALEGLRRSTNLAVMASASSSLAASYQGSDPARALALCEELLQRVPDHWTMLVQRLELRRVLKAEGWDADLASLWSRADTAAKRLDLLTHTLAREGAEAGLTALDRLPPAEAKGAAASLAEAGALFTLGRWSELQALCARHVAAGTDGAATYRFMAFRVLALRGGGDAAGAGLAFDELAKRVADQPQSAELAAQMLETGRMPGEAARLHQLGAKAGGDEGRVALARALGCALTAGNTPLALELAEALLQQQSDDPVAANAVAVCLNTLRRDPDRALTLARLTTGMRPDSAGYQETLATALMVKGDTVAALAVFEKLPDVVKADPSTRLHHAEALQASGDASQARSLVQGIDPAQLLPEDRDRLTQLLKE